MSLPLQITFHQMDHSHDAESLIREKVDGLTHHCDRITRCRVVVEQPQRHSINQRNFNVRVDLHVPGSELVANHNHHEDLPTAIRFAFEDATRQLDSYLRKHH